MQSSTFKFPTGFYFSSVPVMKSVIYSLGTHNIELLKLKPIMRASYCIGIMAISRPTPLIVA